MFKLARFGAIVATVVTLGLVATGTSLAATTNHGQEIPVCARMALPPAGPNGQVSMTMDGTTLSFPTFGAMVRYMQPHSMCS